MPVVRFCMFEILRIWDVLELCEEYEKVLSTGRITPPKFNMESWKGSHWKRRFLLETIIFRFHVKRFRGSIINDGHPEPKEPSQELQLRRLSRLVDDPQHEELRQDWKMHQFPVKEGGWKYQEKILYSLFPKSVEICCKKKRCAKKKHKHPKATAPPVFSVLALQWAAGLLGQTFVKAGMPFGIPWLTWFFDTRIWGQGLSRHPNSYKQLKQQLFGTYMNKQVFLQLLL